MEQVTVLPRTPIYVNTGETHNGYAWLKEFIREFIRKADASPSIHDWDQDPDMQGKIRFGRVCAKTTGGYTKDDSVWIYLVSSIVGVYHQGHKSPIGEITLHGEITDRNQLIGQWAMTEFGFVPLTADFDNQGADFRRITLPGEFTRVDLQAWEKSH
jgi:hypothetical protein